MQIVLKPKTAKFKTTLATRGFKTHCRKKRLPNTRVAQPTRVDPTHQHMHWAQVCLIAQSFTAPKQGASFKACEPVFRIFAPQPPEIDGLLQPDASHALSLSLECLQPKLCIMPKFQDFLEHESWLVRLSAKHSDPGKHPPIYFPPVNTPEALRKTLNRAWDAESPGILGTLRIEQGRRHPIFM